MQGDSRPDSGYFRAHPVRDAPREPAEPERRPAAGGFVDLTPPERFDPPGQAPESIVAAELERLVRELASANERIAELEHAVAGTEHRAQEAAALSAVTARDLDRLQTTIEETLQAVRDEHIRAERLSVEMRRALTSLQWWSTSVLIMAAVVVMLVVVGGVMWLQNR
ncbi:MAG: hypothetical protein U0V73_02715 [Acidimicrobiia bacterium]